eukprot:GHVQ01031381.1.p1 GENE.GHVQ01031381.1~~GHVQ01031381.1.p1  ORF type:complete len:1614 (+),score=231.11 GHVQ01031381.1:570-4844(+)
MLATQYFLSQLLCGCLHIYSSWIRSPRSAELCFRLGALRRLGDPRCIATTDTHPLFPPPSTPRSPTAACSQPPSTLDSHHLRLQHPFPSFGRPGLCCCGSGVCDQCSGLSSSAAHNSPPLRRPLRRHKSKHHDRHHYAQSNAEMSVSESGERAQTQRTHNFRDNTARTPTGTDTHMRPHPAAQQSSSDTRSNTRVSERSNNTHSHRYDRFKSPDFPATSTPLHRFSHPSPITARVPPRQSDSTDDMGEIRQNRSFLRNSDPRLHDQASNVNYLKGHPSSLTPTSGVGDKGENGGNGGTPRIGICHSLFDASPQVGAKAEVGDADGPGDGNDNGGGSRTSIHAEDHLVCVLLRSPVQALYQQTVEHANSPYLASGTTTGPYHRHQQFRQHHQTEEPQVLYSPKQYTIDRSPLTSPMLLATRAVTSGLTHTPPRTPLRLPTQPYAQIGVAVQGANLGLSSPPPSPVSPHVFPLTSATPHRRFKHTPFPPSPPATPRLHSPPEENVTDGGAVNQEGRGLTDWKPEGGSNCRGSVAFHAPLRSTAQETGAWSRPKRLAGWTSYCMQHFVSNSCLRVCLPGTVHTQTPRGGQRQGAAGVGGGCSPQGSTPSCRPSDCVVQITSEAVVMSVHDTDATAQAAVTAFYHLLGRQQPSAKPGGKEGADGAGGRWPPPHGGNCLCSARHSRCRLCRHSGRHRSSSRKRSKQQQEESRQHGRQLSRSDSSTTAPVPREVDADEFGTPQHPRSRSESQRISETNRRRRKDSREEAGMALADGAPAGHLTPTTVASPNPPGSGRPRGTRSLAVTPPTAQDRFPLNSDEDGMRGMVGDRGMDDESSGRSSLHGGQFSPTLCERMSSLEAGVMQQNFPSGGWIPDGVEVYAIDTPKDAETPKKRWQREREHGTPQLTGRTSPSIHSYTDSVERQQTRGAGYASWWCGEKRSMCDGPGGTPKNPIQRRLDTARRLAVRGRRQQSHELYEGQECRQEASAAVSTEGRKGAATELRPTPLEQAGVRDEAVLTQTANTLLTHTDNNHRLTQQQQPAQRRRSTVTSSISYNNTVQFSASINHSLPPPPHSPIPSLSPPRVPRNPSAGTPANHHGDVTSSHWKLREETPDRHRGYEGRRHSNRHSSCHSDVGKCADDNENVLTYRHVRPYLSHLDSLSLLKLLDCHTDGQSVSEPMFVRGMLQALRDRKRLAATYKLMGNIVRSTGWFVSGFLSYICLIIFLSLFDIPLYAVISGGFLILIVPAIALGRPLRLLFSGLVFLLSRDPFDIGDRVVVDEHNPMLVTHMNLQQTTLTDSGTQVIMGNSALASSKILNESRAGKARVGFHILLQPDPSKNTLKFIDQVVTSYCKRKSHEWSLFPPPSVEIEEMAPTQYVKAIVSVTHALSWDHPNTIANSRIRFYMDILNYLNRRSRRVGVADEGTAKM